MFVTCAAVLIEVFGFAVIVERYIQVKKKRDAGLNVGVLDLALYYAAFFVAFILLMFPIYAEGLFAAVGWGSYFDLETGLVSHFVFLAIWVVIRRRSLKFFLKTDRS